MLYATLQQASFDYQRLQYNTVVSACMKMLNTHELIFMKAPSTDERSELTENEKAAILDEEYLSALRHGLCILLRVLYPVAPHITSTLWSELRYVATYGDLLDAPWPEADAAALRQDEIELVIQVNGKLRGNFKVPAKATREDVEEMARGHEAVMRHVGDMPIKKVVVVPGRLVNIVV